MATDHCQLSRTNPVCARARFNATLIQWHKSTSTSGPGRAWTCAPGAAAAAARKEAEGAVSAPGFQLSTLIRRAVARGYRRRRLRLRPRHRRRRRRRRRHWRGPREPACARLVSGAAPKRILGSLCQCPVIFSLKLDPYISIVPNRRRLRCHVAANRKLQGAKMIEYPGAAPRPAPAPGPASALAPRPPPPPPPLRFRSWVRW